MNNPSFPTRSALIALSGGVDSALLLLLAKEAGVDVHAATILSEFTPAAEKTAAKEFAASLNVPWYPIRFSFANHDEILENPPERCYLCKKIIMSELQSIANALGIDAVYDGTHADDLSAGDRPGVKALKELGVLSPFADAGITKAEILEEAARRNIPSPPPSACLATRIPHGTRITAEALETVDAAETLLRECGILGILRVRLSDTGKATVETEASMRETAKLYENKLKQLGIQSISFGEYRGA